MGKPAARVGDKTAHGGALTGPGASTVFIGGKPAAILGDRHECSRMAGPVPHVGGPVTQGSRGVLIGKKPVARLGDMAECLVGGGHAIAAGFATVLIGEEGGGSRSTIFLPDAASGIRLPGPQEIEAFPPMEPPESPKELHWARFRICDSSGRPLPGVPYLRGVPDGREIPGVTDMEGRGWYEGMPVAGNYSVRVRTIAAARWSLEEAIIGDTVDAEIVLDGFEDGTEVFFTVFLRAGAGIQVVLDRWSGLAAAGRIKAAWKIALEAPLASEFSGYQRRDEVPSIHFAAYCGETVALSPPLRVLSELHFELKDPKGRILPGTKLEVEESSGRIIKGSTDQVGRFHAKGLLPWGARISVSAPDQGNPK